MVRVLPRLMNRADQTVRTRARTGNCVSASDPRKGLGLTRRTTRTGFQVQVLLLQLLHRGSESGLH